MALSIVGGTVVDVIFPNVQRLPGWPTHTEFTRSNLELLTEPPLVTIGGNGANAAYVAARCGVTTTLHTNIGRDPFGDLARHWLDCARCHIALGPAPKRTAVNVTAHNARLQRATFFYPGSAPTLPTALAKRDRVTHALVCGWPHPPLPLLAQRLKTWKAAGVFTAFDAGPILGAAPKLAALTPVFAALDLFLANKHEVCTLTKTTSLAAGLAKLRRNFAGHIVIKLGPRGALWIPAGTALAKFVPGHDVKAVNTVGAGDTFNGALLAALARRPGYPAAIRVAHAAAASVVRSSRGVLGLRVPRAFVR